jgi:hypothetical protein
MNTDQLKTRMALLPEPVTNLRPPYWDAWRRELWHNVQDLDPVEFGRWPCIYHTMLVNHWPGPIAYELGALDIMRFHSAITMPHFGPKDYLKDTQYSLNLIHQTYHIQQWENATGKDIRTLDTIVEFGGGYGAMALLCHRLGFEGKYIIYDLPEFSLLQEYYLSQFGLLANVTWNPKDKPKDIDLFMALYSLSEVDPIEREVFKAKSYLYLYSGQWEQWDNVNWFQLDFPTLGYCANWQHSELTHLPDAQNFYSIGF